MISKNRYSSVDQTKKIRSAIAIATWMIPIAVFGCVGWMFATFLLDEERCGQLSSSDPTARSSPLTRQADRAATSVAIRDSEVWNRDWRVGSSSRVSTSPTAMSAQPAAPPVVPNQNMDPPVEELDFGLRLIGTFVEKDRALGLAIAPLGTLTYFRDGEVLNVNGKKVAIQKVRIEGVTVSYQNQSLDWSLGQSLKIGVKQPQSQTIEPRAPSFPESKPPMNLDRELELLNGLNGEQP